MNTLKSYRKKRDFKKTKEPKGKSLKVNPKNIFVIQEHFSKRKHFDFRIQIKKTLKSWAIPKGVPKTTSVKRLAMLTEDHPLEYSKFEGEIPKGNYGAGLVKILDRGSFENIKKDNFGKEVPLSKCFKNGQIEILLKGKKIKGPYALIKFKDEKTWLLIKMKDGKKNKK